MENEVEGNVLTAAIATHELYMSYRHAGFNNQQAMYLVAVVMGNGQLIAPEGVEDDDEG